MYSKKLLKLSAVYGFQKYAYKSDKRKANRYIEMFLALGFNKMVSWPSYKTCSRSVTATNRIQYELDSTLIIFSLLNL